MAEITVPSAVHAAPTRAALFLRKYPPLVLTAAGADIDIDGQAAMRAGRFIL